jgi:myosin heavy subunit
VSVNPFKQLPIYTKKVVKLYIGKSIIAPELRPPPHIFATAEACYYQMRESTKNQSVVIRSVSRSRSRSHSLERSLSERTRSCSCESID